MLANLDLWRSTYELCVVLSATKRFILFNSIVPGPVDVSKTVTFTAYFWLIFVFATF